MSEWSRERRHVSRAYDDWCLVEADIRAFLNLTVQWVTSAHEEAWAAAQAEADRVFDPDRHDIDLPVGFYEEKTSQLWSQNHLWMVNAAALKDAVTAFEVYLEKSALEVVGRYGFQFSTGRLESPPWSQLKAVHEVLGTKIDPDPVRYVRSLRHLLTHQRGELRTPESREKFVHESEDDHRYGREVALDPQRVTQFMNDLAATVADCDRRVWGMAWGSLTVPDLSPLAGSRGPLRPIAKLVAE